jgi:hypothetical protein
MNPGLHILLGRLEYVRPAGTDRWKAKCPVHGGQNKGTLSVKSCSDGMVLLHCHAQECPPLDIVKVCGLGMADIMPERLTHHASPQEKQKWREAATHQDWKEAANVIGAEAYVVWVAGAELLAGRPLNQQDSCRLDKALKELETQRRLLSG